VLVVNESGEPQGWVRGRNVSGPDGATVSEEQLLRGGTLATQGGTLRAALDACLSSPSGRGVVVDSDGRLLGSVTAREVLDLIEKKAAADGAAP
jgi:osmoprotectant transport system ATP-binding protein